MLPPRLERWRELAVAVGSIYKLDPALLLAIMDRESRGGDALKPPGPGGTGDAGHGRGLMQIDDRSHTGFLGAKDWAGRMLWQQPAFNVLYAASLLRTNLDALGGDMPAAVASYNCGLGSVKRALAKMAPNATPAQRIHVLDSYTANRNYVSDVLAKRELYQ